jgi:hypothetical protein
MVKLFSNLKNVILFVFLTLFLVGCNDISGKGMADFGTSDSDKEVLDHFTDVYGDITKSGEPRFLEPIVTSNIIDNQPVDKVTKYSSDIDSLYLWFVYDNFEENDPIEIEWIYSTNGKVINKIETMATGDFGRGVFSLEKSLDSWPAGEYEVVISGRDESVSVSFFVIDGNTISENLPWDNLAENNVIETSKDVSTKPGWYLVESNDFSKKPDDNNYYRYEMDFERGDITWKTFGSKSEVFSTQTTWAEPPSYLVEQEEFSIDVTKKGLDIQPKDIGFKESTDVSIDKFDLGLGSKTAAGYYFADSLKGDTLKITWEDNTGIEKSYSFTGNAPKKGAFNGKFGLRVKTYAGSTQVGTQYVYEWRD